MKNCLTLIANKPQVHLCIALSCEARPLIDYYKLKRRSSERAFEVYCNSDKCLQLIVTGIGKLNAAIATAHTLGTTDNVSHACLLNIGIAGSSNYAIGDAVLAHKIIDNQTRQLWYPAMLKRNKLPTASLTCYDQVQTQHESSLIDMESAGFFQAVSRLSCHDQAQVLKVISDRSPEDMSHIKPALVTHWVAQQLSAIDTVIGALMKVSESQLQATCTLHDEQAVVDRWHFTVYQQHQLRELLRRWQVVQPEGSLWPVITDCDDGAKVLDRLRFTLANASYTFG